MKKLLLLLSLLLATNVWVENSLDKISEGETTGTIGELSVDLYDWGDGSFTGSLEDEDLDLFHWFD